MEGRPTLLALAALLACGPGAVQGQVGARTAVAVTPSLGLAVAPDDGRLASGGVTALLEVDGRRAGWRATLYGEAGGLGVGCEAGDALPGRPTSDACEVGGRALGVGLARLLGPVGVGAGLGALHRSSGWRAQPHGEVSFERGRLRVQLRVEVSGGRYDVHLPVLVGLTLPVR